ncbi:MAG: hypothetical protein AAFX75_03625 [Pseudomonadota bacterium]
MIRTIVSAALLSLALLSAPAGADELDVNTDALVDASAPQRGMTMQRVSERWGEPTRRVAAVGEPPISRWQYDGFTVYFEHDRVIHTVLDRG